MKIVVIGGSGLIGSKLVAELGEHGHEAVSASPSSGVDTITGEGLADVLTGADVVVDVSNAPSFAGASVLEFFRTSTTNLLAAAATAGVGHCVALSVVGADDLQDSGYLRAKVVQEQLIAKATIPYSIVRATQFFEFAAAIGESATVDGVVRVPSALMQPIAADDVAAMVGRVTVGAPLNGVVEIGGPELIGMDDLLRRSLSARDDSRPVVTDPKARYFGAELGERSLVAGEDGLTAETTFADWLKRSA
jgi:uncharacterized protein YbjT (DUF2867 family)